MNPHEPDKLEAAIHTMLRRVPDRRAPAGLEGRVFAEIARRAALPWWRKSFAHWPSPARMAFVAGSALAAILVVAGVVALGRSQGASQVEGSLSSSFAWLVLARDVVASYDSRVRQFLAAIPPLWLYGVIGTVAVCYGTLAAIGAAAYRAVSFERQTS